MPTFTGTNQEFKRYIGPRLRNFVQIITKKHRATIGACEHCGRGENLEAAHIKGRDRNQIIDLLLSAVSAESELTVDLQAFERAFKIEHEPVEKAILILCRQCHKTYDSEVSPELPSSPKSPPSTYPAAPEEPSEVPEGILPISLEPAQSAEFKRRLLVSRSAQITTYYNDGRVEHRPWDASKLSETSNVMGNLRSRPEFRRGEWQRSGIVKVHVRVFGQDA